MIVDFHTHIFPPDICSDRDECLRLDPTFGMLYGDPKSRLATADDLLRSMDEAGIDVSVVLNFAWQDIDLCRRTNDYILEAAAASDGRLVPFCLFAPGDGARDGDRALRATRRARPRRVASRQARATTSTTTEVRPSCSSMPPPMT